MRRILWSLISCCLLFVSVQCVPQGHAAADRYAAWVVYWDAERGLEESAEHATGFSETVCFEAYFEESGEWFVPAESEQIMENYRERELPICLSLVNDVQMDDGSIVQKSKDFLMQTLLTEAARSAHIAKIMQLVRTYRLDCLEIDYENLKDNTELWEGFTIFVYDLYRILNHNGIKMRVVLECRAPNYAELPEGPEYICMCYNLYGYHSGPGPKADRIFLEAVGEDWKNVPGEVHMAFACGGFLWTGDKVQKAMTEQEATAWLEENGITAQRDPDSMALRAILHGEEKYTLWFADGVTLAFWRDTMREQGYHCFDLFRLGGNKAESLALFTGESCS